MIEQGERGEARRTKSRPAGIEIAGSRARKPYQETATWTGYEIAGSKRLVPAFGARTLAEPSVGDIRECVAELAEEVDAPNWTRRP